MDSARSEMQPGRGRDRWMGVDEWSYRPLWRLDSENLREICSSRCNPPLLFPIGSSLLGLAPRLGIPCRSQLASLHPWVASSGGEWADFTPMAAARDRANRAFAGTPNAEMPSA
ncbi:MAG: hypothetical protein CL933_05770 [Deltaproteobacteria bacterium]|nr:hypothetical protein [Deltaproteobacteria bacterium]